MTLYWLLLGWRREEKVWRQRGFETETEKTEEESAAREDKEGESADDSSNKLSGRAELRQSDAERWSEQEDEDEREEKKSLREAIESIQQSSAAKKK